MEMDQGTAKREQSLRFDSSISSHWARLALAALMVGLFVSAALADEVTFSGVITQSTADGTGPAVNNPSLNNIADGDAYTVTLDFPGSITGAGTFNPLAGATMSFVDAAASATETAFDTISLSVITDGSFFDISLLGCLTTGSACNVGNFLAANFQIPAASLNAQNVPATAIVGLLPMELLEDDGVTDIHGSVTTYSYTGAAAVPEPAEFLPMCAGLAAMARLYLRRLKRV